MKIIVFAEQFCNGSWDVWEHDCSHEEIQVLIDAAFARAQKRSSDGQPVHGDFLEIARSTFNVAFGPQESPSNGDLQVYCVCVNQVVVGVYDKVRKYSQRVMDNHEFIESELKKSA